MKHEILFCNQCQVWTTRCPCCDMGGCSGGHKPSCTCSDESDDIDKKLQSLLATTNLKDLLEMSRADTKPPPERIQNNLYYMGLNDFTEKVRSRLPCRVTLRNWFTVEVGGFDEEQGAFHTADYELMWNADGSSFKNESLDMILF
jgi:hypothetical protein